MRPNTYLSTWAAEVILNAHARNVGKTFSAELRVSTFHKQTLEPPDF